MMTPKVMNENEVAVRKRLAIVECKGNCERGGERNDAAHAHEADRKRSLPWRRWITLCERRANPSRNIGCRENPDESRGYHQQRNPGSRNDQFAN